MMGLADVLSIKYRAKTETSISKGISRTNHLRARIRCDQNGELWVNTERNQSSGSLRGLAGADALVVTQPHSKPVEAGEWVDVLLLSDMFHPHPKSS